MRLARTDGLTDTGGEACGRRGSALKTMSQFSGEALNSARIPGITCLGQQVISHHRRETHNYYKEERREKGLYFQEEKPLFQNGGKAV